MIFVHFVANRVGEIQMATEPCQCQYVPTNQKQAGRRWSSSWIHLVRLHARVRRVIHNMLNPEDRQNNKELQPEEIRDAQDKIVQRAQPDAFCEKYEALKGKKPIQHSILLRLNPMLDEQGLIQIVV